MAPRRSETVPANIQPILSKIAACIDEVCKRPSPLESGKGVIPHIPADR